MRTSSTLRFVRMWHRNGQPRPDGGGWSLAGSGAAGRWRLESALRTPSVHAGARDRTDPTGTPWRSSGTFGVPLSAVRGWETRPRALQGRGSGCDEGKQGIGYRLFLFNLDAGRVGSANAPGQGGSRRPPCPGACLSPVCPRDSGHAAGLPASPFGGKRESRIRRMRSRLSVCLRYHRRLVSASRCPNASARSCSVAPAASRHSENVCRRRCAATAPEIL